MCTDKFVWTKGCLSVITRPDHLDSVCKGVTRVLQRNYRGITWEVDGITGVLQGCYRGVTGVLQAWYRGVTGVLHGVAVGFTGVLQRNLRVLQKGYRCVSLDFTKGTLQVLSRSGSGTFKVVPITLQVYFGYFHNTFLTLSWYFLGTFLVLSLYFLCSFLGHSRHIPGTLSVPGL